MSNVSFCFLPFLRYIQPMKLAIFYMEEIPTLFLLRDAARKVGFSPSLFHLRDLRFFAGNGAADLRVGKTSLKEFDLIFVRGFWNYQNEVSLLAAFCRLNKIPLLDTTLLNNPIISKNNDLLRFHEAGLPVPKTLFLENRDSLALLNSEFSFPIVAKEIRGKRGFDVHLLANKKQLQEFLQRMILPERTFETNAYQFQEYIPADFDVRVLVLGKRILGAIERRSADPRDFRHNISLGGSARIFPLTKKIEKLACAAAVCLDYQFAGVDFIFHKKTGKLYLLEVNRSPGFEGFMQATKIDVPLELMRFFLHFARKKIQ